MNPLKLKNALKVFAGHKGPRTIEVVLDEIGPQLASQLTGKQLGQVMNAMQRARANAKKEPGE